MRASIYARKSTEQHGVSDEHRSIARQVTLAKAFIAERGWSLDPSHVFEDDGVSGELFTNRADFQRMMRAAASGALDTLVIYDLDRLGRNARKLMESLHTLADLGVRIFDCSINREIDLNSFEGELTTFLRAKFAEQERQQARKRTRDALRQRAKNGKVTGCAPYGFKNSRLPDGSPCFVIDEGQAAVVRDIYQRFAAGAGLHVLAKGLNERGIPSPRRGGPWSATVLRSILRRSLYRGLLTYGTSARAYGRELGRARAGRERGQVALPEASWIRVQMPHLALVDVETAASVDARLDAQRAAYAPDAKARRQPIKRAPKFLLSGGALVCPTCGMPFEGRSGTSWRGRSVYVCASRRRRPGSCSNRLVLDCGPVDASVLAIVEDELLAPSHIDRLLTLVEQSGDDRPYLLAERERLQTELSRLVTSLAAGVPASAVAGPIKEREAALTTLDQRLARPVPAATDVAALRAALERRVEDWTQQLRSSPAVARRVLRELVGPITLHEEPDGLPDYLSWSGEGRPEGLLNGLTGASPDGQSPA